MQPTGGEYHVIVIGAGQAGQKAARTVAENGYSVLYMPANPGTMFSMMYQSPDVGQHAQIVQEWKPEHPKDAVSPFMQVQTFSAPGEGNGWVIQAYVNRPLLSSRKTLPEDHVVQERERLIREKMVRRHGLLRTERKLAEPIEMTENPADTVEPAVLESGPSEPVYREREVHLRKKMMGYRNIWNDKPVDPEPTPAPQLHKPETPASANESEAAPKESLYRVEEIWTGYPSLSNSKKEKDPDTSQRKKSKQHLIRLDPSRAGRRVRTFDTQASSWRSSSAASESLVWQDNETQPESRTARPQSKSYDQISYLEAEKQKKRKPATAKKRPFRPKKPSHRCIPRLLPDRERRHRSNARKFPSSPSRKWSIHPSSQRNAHHFYNRMPHGKYWSKAHPKMRSNAIRLISKTPTDTARGTICSHRFPIAPNGRNSNRSRSVSWHCAGCTT